MPDDIATDVTTDITPTREEARDERAMAFVRLVASLATIVNVLAAGAGWEPLGIDADLLYTVASGVLAIIANIWAWWKNNNVTAAAQAGQRVVDILKSGEAFKGVG